MQIITNCPSCDSKLERVKDQLFCRNKDCGDFKLKRIEKFAKGMKIKGLGIKTIEKLELDSVLDIYLLTKESVVDKLQSEKIADKLITEINNSRITSILVFLPSCSIPLVGTSVASKLQQYCNSPEDITREVCEKAGLGQKATDSLLNWIDNEYDFSLPLEFSKVETKPSIQSSVTVCATGRFAGYTKASLADMLASYNINAVDTVSSKTTYLLCDERKGSAKEKKAESLKIEILTLNELMEKLNNEY